MNSKKDDHSNNGIIQNDLYHICAYATFKMDNLSYPMSMIGKENDDDYAFWFESIRKSVQYLQLNKRFKPTAAIA